MIKKIIFLVFVFFLHNNTFSQAGLNFSVTSAQGYTLTCTKTSLTVSVTANTNNSIQCTWNSVANGTVTGNPVVVSNPDSYTVSVQDLITVETQTQALSILQDTFAPLASGTTETITCPQTNIGLVNIVNLQPIVLSPSPNYTYSWNGPDMGLLTPPNTNTVVIGLPGTYTCIVTNTVNGCSTSVLFTVTCNNVGLDENKSQLPFIKLFPNPIKDKLNVEFESIMEINKITIINSLGQTIFILNNLVSKQEIDLSSFSNGIYFLNTQSNSGQKVFKIIKE